MWSFFQKVDTPEHKTFIVMGVKLATFNSPPGELLLIGTETIIITGLLIWIELKELIIKIFRSNNTKV